MTDVSLCVWSLVNESLSVEMFGVISAVGLVNHWDICSNSRCESPRSLFRIYS